ncbi:MAG: PorV/PorQ family protein [Bacteroidales bacterium]|nr:PorV/PorQ family protein [Bacteroidales bacterium]
MKRILRIFAVVVILTALSAPSAQAGNDERRGTTGASELLINPWTRSSGWGGVNVASVRGLESMFNNVAGLAFIDGFELAYSNTMLYGGRSGLNSGALINTFGLGIRLFDRGVMGVYVMSMGFGDIDVTSYTSPEPGMNGTFSPSYMNINVAYAHSFTRSIHGGAVVKVVTESTDNVSASGFGIDAGIQYVTGADDQLKFGIALRNWGPTMSFEGAGLSLQMIGTGGNNFTVETRSAEMQLPTHLNIGLSYDFLFEKWDQRLTVAGSFTSNAFLRDNYTLGLEYSLLKMFQLRTAYTFQPGLWSNDHATANNGLSAGASIEVPLHKKESDSKTALVLDYSYRTAEHLKGTHSFGASLRF